MKQLVCFKKQMETGETVSGNNSKYYPSQAIRAFKGISRKRFYEMLNKGEISYETEKWGKKPRRVIDGSELARVFGKNFVVAETTKSDKEKQTDTSETSFKIRLLEQQVDFLFQQLDTLNTQQEEAKNREQNLLDKLDKSQSIIDRQTHLIEDLRDKPSIPPKGFWERWLRPKG